MKPIQFNKHQIYDLDFSMSREFLEANSIGAYSSSTIINSHTRKYHGLLTVRQPQLGADNYVMLSNVDETVTCNSKVFSLGTHQYEGVVEPKGFNLIQEFSLLKIPTWKYAFGNCILKKELLLVSNKNQVLIRYTLLEGKKIDIRLDPFTAFRRIHDLGKEREVELVGDYIDSGIKFWMDLRYDSLCLQVSKKETFAPEPLWFYNTQYLIENDRGYPFEEDLYRPGYFDVSLNKGESFVFSASLKEEVSSELENVFVKELAVKKELTNIDEVLDRAADQFVSKTARGKEVCAGFHWFGRWGRDTFIALPGLTIARGKTALCMEIIDTMLEDIQGGLLTNIGVGDVKEYNSVDASLWFFWTLCELSAATNDKQAVWLKYGAKMKEILQAYRKGTMYNIHMDTDGLLTCGAEGVALTWMDAKVDGEPVTPRRGKPVEINALWYNAIAFSLDCANETNETSFVAEWKPIKEEIESSFIDQFWDEEKGYLADVVTGEGKDWSLRPNQIFSISLPYALISGEQAKQVLNKVESELYTKYGMRTLSPKDSRYVSVYHGDQKTRDNSYHQGIIWPWLIGSYCEANLKTNGGRFLTEIQKINDNFELELSKGGLATISELYHDHDGAGFEGVGTIGQAWSISELIRVNKLAKDYK